MRMTRWIATTPLALLATPALAHGGHVHADANPWTLWQLSPEILLGLAIAGLIYWRGSRHGLVDERWRIVAFFGGLLALFIALISPVERLADHIFAVHQVEHMLLRTVAPMLLFLSRPQAAMVRGLPNGVSKFFAGTGWLRRIIDVLRFPPVATVLFLFASYFWMLPHFHDMAILDEPIHYMWHISLLVTGLLFFSVIFDRRTAPQGPGLGTRLGMFVFAALGNIVLGAFLTFKTVPLYDAYIALGHMWHVSMLTDEQTGGIIMWIPGTMMFAVSAILVIHRWGTEEDRVVSRRMRTGREMTAASAGANRTLALGLVGFAVVLLAIVFSVVAVIDHPHSKARDFGAAGQMWG
ncbi:cytochrome c oxidase assembly protein [Novosphingobium album (ex Hu et al. 2023)]|uniref:Cytochrome c oxidase assembly protein n=1 Tax=Novosphingobium album (ex Hu et al. 2023) TaxID=2930093 RepID=A0ABT0B3J4_9SPHN|nr:cytochrome c oxidase assembly protein [Novosphingobium album (ex Hu et al. 2023)]MCJ2179612.1 cytochrome c oxidase assembly protein [Novosphingobium album (ex Hu et al. 2023)]